jgi:hypothetical protein
VLRLTRLANAFGVNSTAYHSETKRIKARVDSPGLRLFPQAVYAFTQFGLPVGSQRGFLQ